MAKTNTGDCHLPISPDTDPEFEQQCDKVNEANKERTKRPDAMMPSHAFCMGGHHGVIKKVYEVSDQIATLIPVPEMNKPQEA